MCKAVLTSIKPEFCNLIVYGRKVYEVRKTRPKLNTPFTSYIYCTKGTGVTFNVPISNIKLFEHFIETGSKKSLNCPVGNGKVIGEFICDEIEDMLTNILNGKGNEHIRRGSCLSGEQLNAYAKGKNLFGWHISELKIYDVPKEPNEFRKPELPLGLRYENDKILKAPQSWCYVEEREDF